MKILTIIFIACFSLSSFAQPKSIEFDYSVDYAVPNKKKQTKDTIQISFTKDGKFLHTRNQKLGQELMKEFMSSAQGMNDPDAKFDLLFDTEKLDVHVNLSSKSIEFYIRMNMEFIMQTEAKTMNESVSLETARVKDRITRLDKELEVFFIWPSIKPENKMLMGVYPEFPVNNNVILKSLLNTILISSNPDFEISMDLPNGIILLLEENGTPLIEAVAVKEINKKLELSHHFNFSE